MSTELFSSAFPPDEGSFAGAIALRLASGSASAADVADEFSQLATRVPGVSIQDGGAGYRTVYLRGVSMGAMPVNHERYLPEA